MKLLFCLLVTMVGAECFAQQTNTHQTIDNHTIFIIDSQRVAQSEINRYKPTDIASVSIFKDNDAVSLIGPQGKNGVVFIETIAFAKRTYLRYLRTRSPDYALLIDSLKSDSSIQYILNGRILKTNFEGELAMISNERFKNLKVISKATLQMDYGVSDKIYGVLIEASLPKNYYHD